MYRISIPTVVDNGHFNKEKTLAEVKRAGAHRVVLALSRDVEAAFTSEANLKLLKELIDYFEKNGLETAVWLGETLGHSAFGVKFYPQYGHIRHLDGQEIASFCPTDPVFTADFVSWVQKVAKAGARMIMLDDDFRLGCRGGIGCCCDRHMTMVQQNLGRGILREEIMQEAFCGPGGAVRDAWMKAQGDSLRSFCRALRKGLDEVDPEIRLGFCVCLDTWDTGDTDPEELAGIMAGSTQPFLRLIGAPYWTAKGFGNETLGEVIEYQRLEKHWIRDSYIEVFSEGDSYPRPRNLVPAALLEGYDSALRADGTLDGILKYMLDYVSDADYETGYVDATVRNKPMYTAIEKYFPEGKAVGIRPYEVLHRLKEADLDPSRKHFTDEVQRSLKAPSIRFAVNNSLPISYEANQPLLLFGENARHVGRAELDKGAIIDYPAACLLMERGYDIGVRFIKDIEEAYESLSFTDVPVEYVCREQICFRLNGSVKTELYEIGAGAEILTQYRIGERTLPGWVKVETKDGLRLLILPFSMQDAIADGCWMSGYAHRRLLLEVLPWLQKEPLYAVTVGKAPMLYEMVKKDETGLSIGLWNFHEDKVPSKSISISLKEKWNRAEFIRCRGHLEEGRVVLDSTLYPYEFAGIRVER